MHYWGENWEQRLLGLFFAPLEFTLPSETVFFEELRGEDVPLKVMLREELGLSPRVEPEWNVAFELVGLGRLRELLLYRSDY